MNGGIESLISGPARTIILYLFISILLKIEIPDAKRTKRYAINWRKNLMRIKLRERKPSLISQLLMGFIKR